MPWSFLQIHFTAKDIFTQKQMDMLEMSTANVEVPYVQRTEYSMIDINEDFLSLMFEDGSTRQDIRTPPQFKNELTAKFNEGINIFITVTKALGQA